jgi:hypothetical protein
MFGKYFRAEIPCILLWVYLYNRDDQSFADCDIFCILYQIKITTCITPFPLLDLTNDEKYALFSKSM